MPSIPTPTDNNTLTQAEQTARDADFFSLASYRDLVRILNNGLRIVWNNASGLTPQQACDAQGADVVDRFRDHGNLTAFVCTLALNNGIDPLTGCKIATGKQVADPVDFPKKNFTVGETAVKILETDYVPPTLEQLLGA